jgi:hypothetical protein
VVARLLEHRESGTRLYVDEVDDLRSSLEAMPSAHHPGERSARRVAGSHRPLGRALGDRGSLLRIGSDGLGEVYLEVDVEPKRPRERERTLEQ